MAATSSDAHRPAIAPASPASVGRAWVPRLHGAGWPFAGRWLVRLVVVTVGLAVLGLALPLLASADRALFDAVNGLGYGPEWVFELLDPHERLYRGLLLLAVIGGFVLRGPWVAVGVAVALMSAATVSYLLLEAVALLSDRPRPQAVFESILKPPGADWAQASYPSGHVTVTMAMGTATAMTVRALRWPMITVIAVIAWSRIAFGAHFPLDVVGGIVLGYAVAAFSVATVVAVGLLPGAERRRGQPPRSSTAARSATSSNPPSSDSSRCSGNSPRT